MSNLIKEALSIINQPEGETLINKKTGKIATLSELAKAKDKNEYDVQVMDKEKKKEDLLKLFFGNDKPSYTDLLKVFIFLRTKFGTSVYNTERNNGIKIDTRVKE